MGKSSTRLFYHRLPSESPAPHMRIRMSRARVLVLNSALGPLDYRVPHGMSVEPGSIVVAPLGPRQLMVVLLLNGYGLAWKRGRTNSWCS